MSLKGYNNVYPARYRLLLLENNFLSPTGKIK